MIKNVLELTKFLDIYQYLPYQRHFILINGIRSIGKSYGVQKLFISEWLKSGKEFIYIVRTQDQKKKGVFEKAFKKVILKEFPQYFFEFNKETALQVFKDDEGEVTHKTVMGYCLALSESVKIKLESFPKVYYMMFDEYMIEKTQQSTYVNGWEEPNLLLSIYHTVDREEDRVICFMLGNNTSFYNPYHMHKSFNIPNIKQGQMFLSENVIFHWCMTSKELEEQKEQNKFLNMLNGTEYGSYAVEGNYIDDNLNFIEKRTPQALYMFTIFYNNIYYGVWLDNKVGKIFIDNNGDKNFKTVYALTLEDMRENTLLTRGKPPVMLKFVCDNFKKGNLYFSSMEVKVKIFSGLQTFL